VICSRLLQHPPVATLRMQALRCEHDEDRLVVISTRPAGAAHGSHQGSQRRRRYAHVDASACGHGSLVAPRAALSADACSHDYEGVEQTLVPTQQSLRKARPVAWNLIPDASDGRSPPSPSPPRTILQDRSRYPRLPAQPSRVCARACHIRRPLQASHGRGAIEAGRVAAEPRRRGPGKGGVEERF
jgi:hypothetical protein